MTEPRKPVVNGVEVDELSVLFPPDRVAWLVTADKGNHEFGRVFYHEGKYRVREGFARVGGNELLHAMVDHEGTLHLTWNFNRHSSYPREWFQMSYRVAQ